MIDSPSDSVVSGPLFGTPDRQPRLAWWVHFVHDTHHRPSVARVLGLVSIAALTLLAVTPGTAPAQGGARAAADVPNFCKLGNAAWPGRTSVLTLSVRHTGCATGKRLVRAYHECRIGQGDGDGSCVRRVDGYRCSERRSNEVPGAFKARVSCRDGARRVMHRYTWFGDAPVVVDTEAELRAAWADPLVTGIELNADIFMRSCLTGGPIRESLRPLTLDGNGHTIRQTCFEKRLLNQNGTGFLEIRDVTLTRGGNDGPGAAVTTRGEIVLMDSTVHENLSEEPGGGIFSQRKATIIRSVITGNLANDDGGGVYARRGGIQVFDSILSNNLVDGSGGALGSTGDILVVRSHVDGNTTDGDGGAIYTDEDGDITVIDSTVDGNTADGPGGAMFTLEGDVTVVNSTVNANRADDRGGAISGEADVTVINSTIARNAAVAHVGGGIWARSDLYVTNSTISNNYAEGQGGGVLAAGDVGLTYSTIIDNVAPVAANVGAGDDLTGLRLDHRSRKSGAPRRPGPAHRDQLSRYGCRVARLQRRLRRFLRPRRAGRCHRWGRPVARRPRPERRARRDPAARARQPGRGPDPARSLRFRPVRLRPRGRAAPRGFPNRSHRSRHHRPTRGQQGPGCRLRCRRGRGRLGAGCSARTALRRGTTALRRGATAVRRAAASRFERSDHEPRRRPLDTC